MDFFFKGMNDGASDTVFSGPDIQRCPFLRNMNTLTSFPFSPANFPSPARGAKGPIFEDGPNFEMAFKLFHGENGIVPLSENSYSHGNSFEPQFNPLAAKAATISLTSFGSKFSLGDFFSKNRNNENKKSKSLKNRDPSSEGHKALGNVWFETGNCQIAKSYRTVSEVLPLVKTFQQPPGKKFRHTPAIVSHLAAQAQTAFDKTLRPQPLLAKMGLLGIPANIPLGTWKFSPSWFAAIHGLVPFIKMLRKSVLMPKNAMAVAIGAFILGLVIGSRAVQIFLEAKEGSEKVANAGAHKPRKRAKAASAGAHKSRKRAEVIEEVASAGAHKSRKRAEVIEEVASAGAHKLRKRAEVIEEVASAGAHKLRKREKRWLMQLLIVAPWD